MDDFPELIFVASQVISGFYDSALLGTKTWC